MKKKLLSVIVFCAISIAMSAQFFEKNDLYFTGGIGIGNCCGLDVNANCIFNNKLSLSAGYSSFIRVSKTIPDDYQVGAFEAAFLVFTFPIPMDKMKNYQILTGKIWTFENKPKIRLNTQIGLGYSFLSNASNWKIKEDSYGYTTNYSYEQVNEKVFSLIIKPSIEFLPTNELGWFIAPMCIINERNKLYFCVNGGFIIGKIK